jgi:hypothetical protein
VLLCVLPVVEIKGSLAIITEAHFVVNERGMVICNSDTIEFRDRIGARFGVAIVTAQHGKRVRLASCQRPIVGRVCIGILRAFLWDRESPKGCLLTMLYCLVKVGETLNGL